MEKNKQVYRYAADTRNHNTYNIEYQSWQRFTCRQSFLLMATTSCLCANVLTRSRT